MIKNKLNKLNNLNSITNGISKITTIIDYESIILVIVCAVSLGVFTIYNANNNLMNYYYNESRGCYYLLLLIYSIFTMGIVYNSKYIFNLFMSYIFKK